MAIFAQCSHVPLYNAPIEGTPWNYVTGGGARKTIMMLLSECQINVTICPFVLTYQHWTDWRTDRQTDRQTDRTGKTISHSACIGMLMQWYTIKNWHIGLRCLKRLYNDNLVSVLSRPTRFVFLSSVDVNIHIRPNISGTDITRTGFCTSRCAL